MAQPSLDNTVTWQLVLKAMIAGYTSDNKIEVESVSDKAVVFLATDAEIHQLREVMDSPDSLRAAMPYVYSNIQDGNRPVKVMEYPEPINLRGQGIDGAALFKKIFSSKQLSLLGVDLSNINQSHNSVWSDNGRIVQMDRVLKYTEKGELNLEYSLHAARLALIRQSLEKATYSDFRSAIAADEKDHLHLDAEREKLDVDESSKPFTECKRRIALLFGEVEEEQDGKTYAQFCFNYTRLVDCLLAPNIEEIASLTDKRRRVKIDKSSLFTYLATAFDQERHMLYMEPGQESVEVSQRKGRALLIGNDPSEKQDVSLHFYFLVDVSYSMKPSSGSLKKAIRNYFHELEKSGFGDCLIKIIPFNDEVYRHHEEFKISNGKALESLLSDKVFDCDGKTAMNDAVDLLLDELNIKQSHYRHNVVAIMTDGNDNQSASVALTNIRTSMEKFGPRPPHIDTMAIGADVNDNSRQTLQRLSALTGGDFHDLTKVKEIPSAILAKIQKKTQSRAVFEFVQNAIKTVYTTNDGDVTATAPFQPFDRPYSVNKKDYKPVPFEVGHRKKEPKEDNPPAPSTSGFWRFFASRFGSGTSLETPSNLSDGQSLK